VNNYIDNIQYNTLHPIRLTDVRQICLQAPEEPTTDCVYCQ